MHHHRSRPILLPARIPLVLLLCIAVGCGRASKSANIAPEAGPETGSVTFVQWSDPHVFDAGASREDKPLDKGIEEEQLDNWSALHWAVLQTNRLVRDDRKPIDFVVITGDFGLYNVLLSPAGKYDQEACMRDPKPGPVPPVSMDEAARLIARELSALDVKRVYLVPGNNDLCNENPGNLYRWAEFVLKLRRALQFQRQAAQESLDCAKKVKPEVSAAVPEPPQIIDLTFTAERLLRQGDKRVTALYAAPATPEAPMPCQPKFQMEPQESTANKGTPGKDTANSFAGKATAKTAAHKPRKKGAIAAAQPAQPIPSPEVPFAPVEHGFSLLGLDSAYFKPNEISAVQDRSSQSSAEDMKFVSSMMGSGSSYLLFTHVPDVEDPYPGRVGADEGSSWKIPPSVRESWNGILRNENLVAVFSSHFHDGRREIYPHNFAYAKKAPNPLAAQKIWVAPPLAAKFQNNRPVEKTARGMLLVQVTRRGSSGVSPLNAAEVEALPIWFSPLDEKSPLPADDKLAAARADEVDRDWDGSATKYKALLDSDKADSATRTTALAGYMRARKMMDQWWWQSPIARWFYLHGLALLYSLALVLAFLLACWVLRRLWGFRLALIFMRLLLVPKFKGRARLNSTAKMSSDAPVDGFPAQMLAAGEEIRVQLEKEQKAWAARNIALLVPAGSAFDDLVSNIPKVKDVDVGNWLKFVAALMRLFQWNVDTGVAVLPPAGGTAAPAPGAPAALPLGGELSGYAVLRWGWFVRNRWRRSIKIQTGSSATTELARQLAALVLGEAFL